MDIETIDQYITMLKQVVADKHRAAVARSGGMAPVTGVVPTLPVEDTLLALLEGYKTMQGKVAALENAAHRAGGTRRRRYREATRGRFVSKQRVAADPAGTVTENG